MVYEIKDYQSPLRLLETQEAIKEIKDDFESRLSKKLNLLRVSAPLFVTKGSGLNDDLNGSERKVGFHVDFEEEEVEIVQSLAKWKRHALSEYGFPLHKGLYTDMNAIRKDEQTDNIHSIYVDQWDWEKPIAEKERNLDVLFQTVKDIYSVLKEEENHINSLYPCFKEKLPDEITFISSDELESLYPSLSRKERETSFAKIHKAYFLYHIGWPLKDGKPHDGRAPDYDDWNLNGDIIFFNPVLDSAFEISSMGIRVDANSLLSQVKYLHKEERLESEYAKHILDSSYPFTIGGGIGQSRLCMFYLEKAHIGEVQSSLWKKEDKEKLLQQCISLL